MSYEFEFDDIHYDTGYGEQSGDLIVEVEPVYTDESFGAHNAAGQPQTYGGMKLTGVEVLDATLFLVGNNGQELGEVDLTDQLERYINMDDLLELVAQKEN